MTHPSTMSRESIIQNLTRYRESLEEAATLVREWYNEIGACRHAGRPVPEFYFSALESYRTRVWLCEYWIKVYEAALDSPRE